MIGDALHDDHATAITDTRSTELLVGPTTPSNPYVPNESLAANLATLTKIPQKVAASNSGKKRRQPLDLSRSVPNPSHGAKMSNIFRDASTTVQALRPSPSQHSPNIKRSRLPLSQARNTRFGSASRVDDGPLHSAFDEIEREDPISSGFTTPSRHPNHLTDPSEEKHYPSLEAWRSPPSLSIAAVGSSLGSDDRYAHSNPETVGVDLPLRLNPDAQGTRIDSWLDGIPEPTEHKLPSDLRHDINWVRVASVQKTCLSPAATSYKSSQKPGTAPLIKPLGSPGALSRTSSDKENTSPVKTSSSPTPTSLIPQYIVSTPSRFNTTKNRTLPGSTGTRRSVHPLSPQGHLSLPAKRKRARLDDDAVNISKAAPKAGKDFTIHDDKLAQALAGLSPLVERHRKGRGPKRERCGSYFDEDFIQNVSPAAYKDKMNNESIMLKNRTKVLSESNQSAELTNSNPCMEEAGTAAFNFSV